jgi:hypothetical protein
LGDKDFDPKLPVAIKLVHLTMDFKPGTEDEFAAAIPGYEVKVADLREGCILQPPKGHQRLSSVDLTPVSFSVKPKLL